MSLIINDISSQTFNNQIPKDLETICLKCLEKAADRRYQTAADLREELRRFLRGEPVQARPITNVARAWRWCKRHPARALLLTLMLVLAVVGPTFAIHMGTLAASESQLRREAVRSSEERRRLLYASDMAVAERALKMSKISRVIELLDRHVPNPGESDLRGFEWYYLWACCEGTVMSPIVDRGSILGLSFTADGKQLSFVNGTTMQRIDARSLEFLDKESLVRKDGIRITLGEAFIEFSPDGNTSAAGGHQGEVVLTDFGESEQSCLVELESTVSSISFSPDNRLIAAGDADGNLAVWNRTTRELLIKVDAHSDKLYAIVFSWDGRIMATGSRDQTIKLWDLQTFDVISGLSVDKYCDTHSPVHSLAFFPDGKTLIAGTSGDNAILFWDVSEFPKVTYLRQFRQDDTASKLDFSPNGQMLAVAGNKINIWDLNDGTTVDLFRGEVNGRISDIAFSPDGKWLATGTGPMGELRLWSLESGENPQVLNYQDNVLCGAIATDGSICATGDETGQIVVFDAVEGEEIMRMKHGATIEGLAISPNNHQVASGGHDQLVKVWDTRTGTDPVPLRHDSDVIFVKFSPLGNILASGSQDGVLSLWDLRTRTRTKIKSHDNCHSHLNDLEFTPDGKTVALSGIDVSEHGVHYNIRFWDVESRRMVREIPGISASKILISPDGSLAAFGSTGFVLIWDLIHNTEKHRLLGHEGVVQAVCFSPNSQRLYTGDQTTVRAWDVVTGEQQFEQVAAHRDSISFVAITPNSETLITGSKDNSVKLWRAAAPRQVDVMRKRWEESESSGAAAIHTLGGVATPRKEATNSLLGVE